MTGVRIESVETGTLVLATLNVRRQRAGRDKVSGWNGTAA